MTKRIQDLRAIEFMLHLVNHEYGGTVSHATIEPMRVVRRPTPVPRNRLTFDDELPGYAKFIDGFDLYVAERLAAIKRERKAQR